MTRSRSGPRGTEGRGRRGDPGAAARASGLVRRRDARAARRPHRGHRARGAAGRAEPLPRRRRPRLRRPHGPHRRRLPEVSRPRGRPAVRGRLPPVLAALEPSPAHQGARGRGRRGRADGGAAVADRQLARARGVGHVRRALRGPSRPAAPLDVRGVRRSPAAQGLSDQPAPATDRPADLSMAETTRREIMLGEGSGTGTGQNLTVGMGPAHPAMHGIIRILAELDGEIIRKADVEIGYLHRAFEKDCEVGGWNNAIPYTDRLNYVSPLINNFAYANAVEKLLGIDVTERCKYIRTIMSEISRVCDHLTCIGASAMELGAFTVFLYMIKAREFLWELVEDVTGARLTISYGRVGGVKADLPPDFGGKVKAAFKQVREVLDEVHRLLTGNRIFMDRMVGIGVLSRQQTVAYAITGPLLRAVGVPYDVRRAQPYYVYDRMEFEIPTRPEGDNYARYLVRM